MLCTNKNWYCYSDKAELFYKTKAEFIVTVRKCGSNKISKCTLKYYFPEQSIFSIAPGRALTDKTLIEL